MELPEEPALGFVLLLSPPEEDDGMKGVQAQVFSPSHPWHSGDCSSQREEWWL